MLPRLLTGNNWPQTLLLTALALLIAAATTMLACGPAAAPAPADGNALPPAPQTDGNEPTALPPAQQEGGDTAEESDNAEPPPPPPVPTYTYPNIPGTGLHRDVVEFEEAQDSSSGPSGQSDDAPEDKVVLVRILLSSNKAEVAAWLRGKGITPLYADDPDISNLAAKVPLSLLGELSQQAGVREIREPPVVQPAGW